MTHTNAHDARLTITFATDARTARLLAEQLSIAAAHGEGVTIRTAGGTFTADVAPNTTHPAGSGNSPHDGETYWTEGNPVTVADIMANYGDSGHLIVTLLREGWTVNGAIDHVEGLCDPQTCTHPDHRSAS